MRIYMVDKTCNILKLQTPAYNNIATFILKMNMAIGFFSVYMIARLRLISIGYTVMVLRLSEQRSDWARPCENVSCYMRTTKVQISLRIRAV